MAHLQLRLTRPGWFGDNLGAPVARLRVGTVRPRRAADDGGLLEPRRPAARAGQRSGPRDRACEPRSAPARRASRGNCSPNRCCWPPAAASAARPSRGPARARSAPGRLPTELPVQLDVTADLDGPGCSRPPPRSSSGCSLAWRRRGLPRASISIARSRAPPASRSAAAGSRAARSSSASRSRSASCCCTRRSSRCAACSAPPTASLGWNPDGVVMAATELGMARYDAATGGRLLAAHRRGGARPPRRRRRRRPRTRCRCTSISRARRSTPMPLAEPDAASAPSYYSVAPDYFATLQIPLREGRDFTAFDTRESPQVAIVNRAAAERLFGGDGPRKTGSRGTRRRAHCRSSAWSKTGSTPASASSAAPAIFRPLTQRYANSSMLIVRSSPPGAVTGEDLRRLIHRVDPSAADSDRRRRASKSRRCRCCPTAPRWPRSACSD